MAEAKKIETLAQLIKSMSLSTFIETFLHLWDTKTLEYEPWKLWPKQTPICDLLDKSQKLFWPKARQVGGSQIAAALAVKVALQEPNSEIVIISKQDKKARYFFKKRVLPLLKTLPGKGLIKGIDGFEWGEWKVGATGVVFANGSTIECVATEDDAARGNSARLVIMDEAGTMQHAGDIWKAASPSIEQVYGGQIVVISNSKSGSWFNNMLKKINSGKTKGVDIYFMNLWTEPKRTVEWAEMRKTQFDNEVDFYVEYPETLEQMFLKREGFVYPTFDAQENGRHVYTFDTDWSMRLMYGYDHGFDHFAVFLMSLYDQYQDHLYIFDEMFCSQKDVYEVSILINEKIKYWKERGMPEPWKKIADSSIFAERGQKSVSDLIRAYTKLNFQKSIKHNEEGSTALLRSRFTKNQISFHPRCYETIRQHRDLMFTAAGKPSDRDNDSPDILRYECAELKQEDKPQEKPKRRHYNRGLEGGGINPGPQKNIASFEKDRYSWMVQ